MLLDPARGSALAAALLVAGLAPTAGEQVDPRASGIFERYVAAAEARFLAQVRSDAYLNVQNLPADERREAMAAVRDGEIRVERLDAEGIAGEDVDPDDATIQHWIGTAFVPGATADQALAMSLDFDRYDEIFAPDMLRAEVVERTADTVVLDVRFRRKKVVTRTYDARFRSRIERPAPDRLHSMTRSLEIRRVDDPGEEDEERRPEGEGYLWRTNNYWRVLEADGGVYLENEVLLLLDEPPPVIGVVIQAFLNGAARDAVGIALASMRRELRRRSAAGPERAPSAGAAARYRGRSPR